MRCSSCDVEVPERAKFCPECGARQTAHAITEGENRQLTVMFVDLVGSTALAEQLDPEQLRDVVAAYQDYVGRVVQARGGTIAQYLGDGVLIYFGYPNAHEDDPDRAVLGGLDLLEGLPALNEQLASDFGVRIQLRLGVHTGDVVVAPLGDTRERLAVGMSVNVASRLCDAAGVDSLAISEFTRKLIGADLVLEALGALALKGVSEPVETYRVLGSRDEAHASARSERAFLGREADLAALESCFASARQGRGRCVVIEGEAGIGKSRLLAAFRQRASAAEPRWLEARCSHFHQATALRPVAQIAAQALRLAEREDPAERIAQIEKSLAVGGGGARYDVGLLLQLFGLDVPAGYAPANVSADRIRADTMRVLVEVIRWAANEEPVVLVIEDLHWVDPSTLEVLDRLARIEDLPVLLIVARRPDAADPWQAPASAQLLKLEGLEEDALDALIRFHQGDVELASDVRSLIRGKADGVPLFAEELTKMVVESGFATGGDAAFGVPATLQDSLMARLDRLSRGKPVAQIAAAIGRSFDGDLIARVAELDSEFMAEGFRELLGADLIERVRESETPRYVFRHALIQDAAYGSLLRRHRVRVHGRIADVMLESGVVEAEPARVAHHYAESGRAQQAIDLWMHAGRVALSSSAGKEAILHYERALPLIAELEEADRDARELGLRIGLAHANVATTGYGAPAVRENFRRATEICDRTRADQALFGVASGLWGYQLVHGDPGGADSALSRLKEMAEASGKPRHVFHAHYADGAQSFYAGDFERSRQSLEQADAMVASDVHSFHGYGTTDSAGNCPMYLGWAEHFVGLCDQGYARQEVGVAAAEKAGQAFPFVEAMTHIINLRHDRLEAKGTVEMCDRTAESSIEYGFDFWLGVCYSVRGWAKALLGELDEGIHEASEGLAIFKRTGAYVPYVYRASYLVEALMQAGRYTDALSELDQALAHCVGRYDRFWDAEVFRLRGLCRLHGGAPGAEVEREWLDAIELAERQRARVVSLRVTTTWAEWLIGESRGDEARGVLAQRIDRIQAGEDLADLRRARAVLAAL